MDIRREIANRRLERINKEGYGLSAIIPEEREFPLVDFSKGPFVICEVKRGSPSKGGFAKGLDAISQAKHYQDSGVKHVSVLTEEDRFLGSLNDLMEIKRNCKNIAVLRKDFLLDREDVKTSYLCGADAFLLITSLLDKETLYDLYNYGVSLGMTPLVELHDREDVEKVRDLKPSLTGINSRNLKTFEIDPLRPLKIRSYIDWECNVIYESGVSNPSDGLFVRDAGFSGLLVGEWAVKDKKLASNLVELYKGKGVYNAWELLYKNYSESCPFVKVCGITNRGDAEFVQELGADMLGFILADSPRKVEPEFVRSLKDIDILKVGVVVLKEGETLPTEYLSLIEEGFLDFIQFHGFETPELCRSYDIPYYKALRVKDESVLEELDRYKPVSLVDAFCEHEMGGTGKQIDGILVKAVKNSGNLWLAGGLNPDNIGEIVEDFRPELIDVSSGVEQSPGIKDRDKLIKYFETLRSLNEEV